MAKDTTKANLDDSRQAAIEQSAAGVEANSGLTVPSGGALEKAQKDGVINAVKEGAKNTYKALTDGNPLGEPPARQFTGMDDIQQYAGMLELAPSVFDEKIADGGPVPLEKVAGLLSLERAGQNRTPYVKSMMARLKIKHPGEVTNAGPGYTNDVSLITEL